MSESITYTFNKGGDNEFDYEIGPHNMSLFTFIGENALYNHVFLEFPVEDGQEETPVCYFFSNARDFENLRDIITHYNWPQHLNLTETAQCDLEAFEHSQYRDLRALDSLPEDWEHGTAA